MPTVLKIGPYRLFFYSADSEEPPHVHVERDANVGKLWLDPVRLVKSGGFRRSELREIERMVANSAEHLLEAWHGFFGS